MILVVKISTISVQLSTGIKEILTGINFKLPAGKIYSILGKNGTGKTTFIKSLTRLNEENYIVEGKVLFRDRNIFLMNEPELQSLRKNKIKYIFQDSAGAFNPLKQFRYYFERFVHEREEIPDLLSYFNLPPYESLSRYYPYEVSAGMAQRINFVLVLLTKPELIILDEPTSGLDSPAVNLFLHKMRGYVNSGNNSILLVTQDIQFAEKASDYIALIENKKLSEFYTPESFLKLDNELVNAVKDLNDEPAA